RSAAPQREPGAALASIPGLGTDGLLRYRHLRLQPGAGLAACVLHGPGSERVAGRSAAGRRIGDGSARRAAGVLPGTPLPRSPATAESGALHHTRRPRLPYHLAHRADAARGTAGRDGYRRALPAAADSYPRARPHALRGRRTVGLRPGWRLY